MLGDEGGGCCHSSAKLKKTPLAGEGGPDREEFKGMYGLGRLLPTAEYKDHGSKLFCKGGGDEFGCCCTPCPCCHVSMEMKEGQDVAPSEYLGGWQGKHLVNISPSTPTPKYPAVPKQPPGSLPSAGSTPFPSGAGVRPTGLQSGLLVSGLHSQVALAANSKYVHLVQSSPNRAVCCASGSYAASTPTAVGTTAASHTPLTRQNFKTQTQMFKIRNRTK